MSEKFIPLEKAIRDVIKDGDRINPYALYPDDGKKVILYPEETGYSKLQTIGRDKSLKFFFSPDKNGITTFWGSTTSAKVTLRGEAGAENGEAVIYKVCQPFSNLPVGLKARTTLDGDIHYLRDKVITKRRLQEDNKIAWLGVDYIGTDLSYSYFGLRYVDGYQVGYFGFFGSNANGNIGSYGIRPAVSAFLNSKILVDMEESEKLGIWQLIPKK